MKRLVAVAVAILAFPAQATEWIESRAIGELFSSADVRGAFVVYDVEADVYIGHNKGRAEHRFIPASTFKIANTLIGLASGAVASVDETLPYRGPVDPMVPAWKRDMGLRDAIALSNVPIYQELARRIGLERMRGHVKRLNYGNAEIGAVVDEFWLRGPLAISAVEQTRFLARLAQGTLPVPAKHQQSVRDIVLLEQNGTRSLYGKTGWENAPGPGIGWWVGWIDDDGRVYVFALNMDMHGTSDAGRRIELGKASLRALGLQ